MEVGLLVIEGIVATRRRQPKKATAAVPVLMLTAHVHPGLRERAFDAGCDVDLHKPLDPQTLGVEIRRIVLARDVRRDTGDATSP